MECPKCKAANSDEAQFCTRCHATLLYKCPSCGATQRHDGTCEKCGIDFTKYAAMFIAQEQSRADAEHEKTRERAGALKQLALLPITGGFSLLRFLFRRAE